MQSTIKVALLGSHILLAEMWVRFDVIVGINSVRSRELGELTQLPPQGSLQVSVTQTT